MYFGLTVGFWFFPSQTECLLPYCLPWEKGFLHCWQHHRNSQVLPPSLNTLESMPWTSRSCGHKQVDSLAWQLSLVTSVTCPGQHLWSLSTGSHLWHAVPCQESTAVAAQAGRDLAVDPSLSYHFWENLSVCEKASTECAVFTFLSFLVGEKPNQNCCSHCIPPPRNPCKIPQCNGRFGFLAQIKIFWPLVLFDAETHEPSTLLHFLLESL